MRPSAYEWAPAYRFTRIRQELDAQKRFTLQDFSRLQHDNTSHPGLALARLLRGVDLQDARLQPYADLLTGWDGVLSAEARAGGGGALRAQEGRKLRG